MIEEEQSLKKQLCMMLCAAAMLCSMSVPALAVDADTITENAGETLPLLVPAPAAVYPAEVRVSEENGIAHLEKVYYLTTKDDPTAIPTADFEREGKTYTLLDLLKNDLTETDTKEYIEVLTLDSKTKDLEEIIKTLEPELETKPETDLAPVAETAVEEPKVPEPVLTPEEQQLVNDFAAKIDVENTAQILQ